MPPSGSTALHFLKPGETGGSPGQRITGPSSGNARKLAGLRCGLGHALAPNASVLTAQNPVPANPVTL